MDWIDLRSDTVTLPTQEMREAMAKAEVGDDVFGEDPSINRLESMAAELMGKDAAMFVPSGTMGNLSAILAHCARGDEVILGDVSHTFLLEAGGMAAVGGIQPHTIPNQSDGTLPLKKIEAAIRRDNEHDPITRLICLENTHNRCGGAVLSPEYMDQVGALAKDRNLKVHLDGARIFNAAVSLGVPAEDLTRSADSITFCLSKALCAPVGSVLCGDPEFIRRARRARKLLGGGMRQAGILAAAGIVALEMMVDRLKEDHARAQDLAKGLSGMSGIGVEYDPPPTNMVYLQVDPAKSLEASALRQALLERKVKIGMPGPRRFRLVVHYLISDQDIERVLQSFHEILSDD